GKDITLDGRPFRIVGIMPRGFQFMVPAEEVWVPMGAVLKGGRGGFHLKVIARLKPGATLAKAQTGMATVSDRLAREYPQENRNRTARVEPLRRSPSSGSDGAHGRGFITPVDCLRERGRSAVSSRVGP